MTLDDADIEAYVTGVDSDTVIEALRVELGALNLNCVVDENQRIFDSEGIKAIITVCL